jgi:hypothetical protein
MPLPEREKRLQLLQLLELESRSSQRLRERRMSSSYRKAQVTQRGMPVERRIFRDLFVVELETRMPVCFYAIESIAFLYDAL